MKGKAVFIGDFLHRIKRPVNLEQGKKYKLVTVKLKHNGVVLREEKSGAEIKSKMFEVKAGDFILSGIDARNGAFGIIPPELDGAIVTNDFWYFKIDEQIVDKHFFLELTSTQWFDEICRKGSDGTTQRIRLQKNKFFNQQIFLPNLQEQRTFISQFQQIKENNNVLKQEFSIQQALLKKLRQQILQEAVEGKLTADWRAQNPDVEPASELLARIQAEKEQLVKAKKISKQNPLPPISEEEKPFTLPDGWVWCRLGNFVTSYEAGKSFKCTDRPVVNNEWGIIKTSAVTSAKFIENENKFYKEKEPDDISKQIKSGDLIFCRASGSKELAGKCCLVSEITKKLMLSDKTPRIDLSHQIEKQYVFIQNETNQSKDYYQNLNTGKSTSMNNITKSQLLEKIFTLPPLPEQKAIVAKVEKLLSLCDQLEHEISQNQCRAEQLMQAVLSEAFSQPSGTKKHNLPPCLLSVS